MFRMAAIAVFAGAIALPALAEDGPSDARVHLTGGSPPVGNAGTIIELAH